VIFLSLQGKTIGMAFTGSFCTFQAAFEGLESLIKEGATVQTIFSYAAQSTDTRFGNAKDFLAKAEELTGLKPILTIPDAEPIGPKNMLDILVVFPCTGNTIAKMANAITDTPTLMAAKAHIRNNKPLLLSIATNDALGMNFKNIGELMNAKNIYFVPFGQDDPIKKPKSMIAHTELLIPAIEAALRGEQLQPIIR
jgi:dipicolinate synthase subunit B